MSGAAVCFQEDRHVKILDFTKAARSLQLPIDHLPQPCSFMAIYDGHRGPVCADFVAKNLHLKLLKHLSAKATDIASAMRTACEELDEDLGGPGGVQECGRALLIARPSVNSFRLKRSMRFLALMCDGITDVLSNDEVVMELNFRREKDPAANARKACGDLVQKAYARGSQDNLTVIMVCFDWEGPEVEEPIGPAAKKQRRD
eukprot:g13254.t1